VAEDQKAVAFHNAVPGIALLILGLPERRSGRRGLLDCRSGNRKSAGILAADITGPDGDNESG
jgi:hypothetical protein